MKKTADIDQVSDLISDLYLAKLRASFNSEKTKPHMSKRDYFNDLHQRDIYDLRRTKIGNNSYSGKWGKKIDAIEFMRDFSSWHSSEFSMEFSTIGDEVFKCKNKQLLQGNPDNPESGKGNLTFPELKVRLSQVEGSSDVRDSFGGPSCRRCVEDRHHNLRNDRHVRTFNDFTPADCIIKPMVSAQGLGIRLMLSAEIDESGRVNYSIEKIYAGWAIVEEFGESAIGGLPLSEIHMLNSHTITITFPQLSEMTGFEIRQIWRERGFRQNLEIIPGFESEEGFSNSNTPAKKEISPAKLTKIFQEIKKRTEKNWDPSLFTGPQAFLGESVLPSRREDSRGWPIQYLKMSEKTKRFLNSGLEEKLWVPILIENKIPKGTITMFLDNTELWR